MDCMRVLVDVDLAKALPDKVLVKREGLHFFVNLQNKNIPVFYEGKDKQARLQEGMAE